MVALCRVYAIVTLCFAGDNAVTVVIIVRLKLRAVVKGDMDDTLFAGSFSPIHDAMFFKQISGFGVEHPSKSAWGLHLNFPGFKNID